MSFVQRFSLLRRNLVNLSIDGDYDSVTNDAVENTLGECFVKLINKLADIPDEV